MRQRRSCVLSTPTATQTDTLNIMKTTTWAARVRRRAARERRRPRGCGPPCSGLQVQVLVDLESLMRQRRSCVLSTPTATQTGTLNTTKTTTRAARVRRRAARERRRPRGGGPPCSHGRLQVQVLVDLDAAAPLVRSLHPNSHSDGHAKHHENYYMGRTRTPSGRTGAPAASRLRPALQWTSSSSSS